MGGPGAGTQAVRIVHGFSAYLPGRSRRFFQRNYFSSYPRPIQQAGGSPFPRELPIVRLKAPQKQAIVIRQVTFNAYKNTGVDVDDLRRLDDGSTVGTLGFRFLLGNQDMLDYSTNLPARSDVAVLYSATQGPGATAPQAGQGSLYQGTGRVTPDPQSDPFAAYAMPGEDIVASVVVFRPPPYDLRTFQVEIEGWLAEAVELEKIIDSLSQ